MELITLNQQQELHKEQLRRILLNAIKSNRLDEVTSILNNYQSSIDSIKLLADPIFQHYAVLNGNLNMLKLLQARGSDLSKRHVNMSLLQIAAIKKHYHILNYLLTIPKLPLYPDKENSSCIKPAIELLLSDYIQLSDDNKNRCLDSCINFVNAMADSDIALMPSTIELLAAALKNKNKQLGEAVVLSFLDQIFPTWGLDPQKDSQEFFARARKSIFRKYSEIFYFLRDLRDEVLNTVIKKVAPSHTPRNLLQALNQRRIGGAISPTTRLKEATSYSQRKNTHGQDNSSQTDLFKTNQPAQPQSSSTSTNQDSATSYGWQQFIIRK